MENQILLLHEPEIEPTEQVLEIALGREVFQIYKKLLEIITHEFDLEYEWRFYNDGKSWLLKATHKKKTIFWLSVWERLIKISFYFTEKTQSGVLILPISEKLKENFLNAKAIGKLIPLILEIDNEDNLDNFREIVRYKKGLK